MRTVCVIGGGAAGMMAALAASDTAKVVLIEQNEKLGKKLYITGKGRCNLTNAGDRETFFNSLYHNPRFMYSSFDAFDQYAVMGLFTELGLPLKTERGERVFPESDKSSDVIRTLEKELERRGVKIRKQTKVKELLLSPKKDRCIGVRLAKEEELLADAVVVATGGLSYPSTGSTGDGYRFARQAGLSVTKCYPSLVSFKSRDSICSRCSGISLKNVSLSVKDGKGKLCYSGFGEMLFTHQGVSGPLVLTASAHVADHPEWFPLTLTIDYKPALTIEQLEEKAKKILTQQRMKELHSALGSFLPAKLLSGIFEQAGIDEKKKACEMSAKERQSFCQTLKQFTITAFGTGGFEEAIITKGGVEVKGIRPKTMEVKNVAGLYLAGEVLDLDAHTGGFNLQIAWSTGYAAGYYAGRGENG